MTLRVAHTLTIDFECWPQLAWRVATGVTRPSGGEGLVRQTDRLLELLASRGVTATFFVLGLTARRWPHLVERIAAAGHEIACHGFAHRRLYRQGPLAFRRDVERGISALVDIAGVRPTGFRAPEFTVTRRTLWALDIIARLGFDYDSSIYPIFNRRYGIPGWPTHPSLVAGGRLVELPLATHRVGPVNLPIAGGGYWRLLPLRTIAGALDRMSARGESAVLYVHPFELDTLDPARFGAGLPLTQQLRATTYHLVQNLGRASVFEKLSVLLDRYEWQTAQQHAADVRRGAQQAA